MTTSTHNAYNDYQSDAPSWNLENSFFLAVIPVWATYHGGQNTESQEGERVQLSKTAVNHDNNHNHNYNLLTLVSNNNTKHNITLANCEHCGNVSLCGGGVYHG